MDLPRGKLQVNMAAHFANGRWRCMQLATLAAAAATSSCMQHLPANKIKGKSQPITKITPTHTHTGAQQNGQSHIKVAQRRRCIGILNTAKAHNQNA